MSVKLKRNLSYRAVYFVNAFLLGMAISIGSLGTARANTYAEEDPVQEISASHFVTIHDDGAQLTVKTDAATVAEALERAGILTDETDILDPAADAAVNADNFQINIYRARPVMVVDGMMHKYLMTASYDPAEVVRQAGLTVYDGDEIETSAGAQLWETGVAATYTLTRNGGRTVTVETAIPYGEETVKDADLEVGQTKVVEPGEDGRKVAKYQVNFVDGVETSRELVSEEVAKEPVNRVVAQGTKQPVPPEWETCAGWARAAGVSEADLYTALTIIYHESGCRVSAENAYSGAYGIPQALPGNKMASAGADWETNPVTQIRWMIGYVNGRYGGWSGALNYWNAHGNY